MRSEIFQDFEGFKDQFSRDLAILWSLPDEHRRPLIPGVIEIVQAVTTGEAELAKDRIVSGIRKGNQANLLRALNVLRFIYIKWNPVHDTPQTVLNDVEALDLLPAENKDVAKAFMLAFLSTVERQNVRRLKEMYANSLLPSYVGCATLVDARPVFDKPFSSLPKGKVEEYEPKLIGWTPAVIVRIRRDSGEPTEFIFQCKPIDLKHFIDNLRAVELDLREATKEFPSLEEDLQA